MKNMHRVIQTTVMAALMTAAFTPQTFGAGIGGINPTNTITASMDNGILRTGNTWYELGVNSTAPTNGLKLGVVTGQTDPLSTYLFQPAAGLNALMLDTNRSQGAFVFDRPVSATASLSLARRATAPAPSHPRSGLPTARPAP
jgi:hypothetical protein